MEDIHLPNEDASKAPAEERLVVDEPQGIPVEEPVKRTAKVNEVHTPANTTMAIPVPPQATIVRALTEKEKSDGFITIFLGNSKESHDLANQLLTPYIELLTIRRMVEAQDVEPSVLAKKEEDWARYVEENYPGKTVEEMTDYAASLMEFKSELLDELRVRSNAIREEDISNVSNRGVSGTGHLITGDIVGRKPTRSVGKGMKSSEVMRRSSIAAEDGVLTYDLELRNSFTKITFTRPNKLEMGNIINDIRATIKGFVRQVNNNSGTLARVAAARVIWSYIVKKMTYSSVNDIADFSQLTAIIRWSDMEHIAMGLLHAFSPKSVNMHLRCLSPKCDWNEFAQVDPERMVHCRHHHTTDAEAAVYANIFNNKATLSTQETLALIKNANFGLDSNRVYNENNSIYMELGSPSLSEAFQTFDYFVGQINPKLGELRSKVLDPEEFETQRNMLLQGVGASEYMHWISNYVLVGEPGSDEKDIALERSQQDDQNDYNQGLLDVIKDSPFFNKHLTKAVFSKTPFLSKTFVGLQNFECPKCKKNMEEFHDSQRVLERKLGYTPIDPIMSFFIHIQLLMVVDTTEAMEARVEALSE